MHAKYSNLPRAIIPQEKIKTEKVAFKTEKLTTLFEIWRDLSEFHKLTKKPHTDTDLSAFWKLRADRKTATWAGFNVTELRNFHRYQNWERDMYLKRLDHAYKTICNRAAGIRDTALRGFSEDDRELIEYMREKARKEVLR